MCEIKAASGKLTDLTSTPIQEDGGGATSELRAVGSAHQDIYAISER